MKKSFITSGPDFQNLLTAPRRLYNIICATIILTFVCNTALADWLSPGEGG